MNDVYLLSEFDVSSFSYDWRYVDFQTGHFADFKQFKIDTHFLNLGTSNGPYSFFFTYFGKASYLTDFGKDVRPQKTT